MKGIASFLYHKRHKALHKTVKVMEKKTDLQCNRVHHLEDTMIMYGVYNYGTSTDLINIVYKMQNTTMLKEKNFARRLNEMYDLYLNQDNMHHFAIHSVLYLTTV